MQPPFCLPHSGRAGPRARRVLATVTTPTGPRRALATADPLTVRPILRRTTRLRGEGAAAPAAARLGSLLPGIADADANVIAVAASAERAGNLANVIAVAASAEQAGDLRVAGAPRYSRLAASRENRRPQAAGKNRPTENRRTEIGGAAPPPRSAAAPPAEFRAFARHTHLPRRNSRPHLPVFHREKFLL